METVVAIGIVAATILPVMGLAVLAASSGKEARDEAIAARIGREVTSMVEQADPSLMALWETGSTSASRVFYFDAEGALLGSLLSDQADSVHTARIHVPPADNDLGEGSPSDYHRRFSILVAHRPGALATADIAAVLAGNRPVGEVHRFPGIFTILEK